MASLLSLIRLVRAVGAPRSLLYARIDYRKLQGEPKPQFGVPSAQAARDLYTRDARRVQRQRQLTRRGGVDGFMRAIRALPA